MPRIGDMAICEQCGEPIPELTYWGPIITVDGEEPYLCEQCEEEAHWQADDSIGKDEA